ncbi:unnamed protein product [Spirodela intermedia]|uniref:Bet v I/Major latex protein domain-containing protein n=2 Tax=Spirodela intermedia TaxID=51605 RepID=A0A7I8JEH1_SPIIN|nr:unnamed protein product [Spirodela intermedia]CAA6668165.1 unnamed protein product [Spirodela intermedia]CAA7404998.1 unnamed protein product [Spirodela intermedia]
MTGFTEELSSAIAPSRLFLAGALDSHKLAPILLSEFVSHVAIVEGDGGVGTVRVTEFTDAVPYKTTRERTDVLDRENLEYAYTLLEGGPLGEKIESATYRMKLTASADGGGSVCSVTMGYHPKPGVELTAEEVNADKEAFIGAFQALEAYLLANPNAYA